MYAGQKVRGRREKKPHMKSEDAKDYFSSPATWQKTVLAKY